MAEDSCGVGESVHLVREAPGAAALRNLAGVPGHPGVDASAGSRHVQDSPLGRLRQKREGRRTEEGLQGVLGQPVPVQRGGSTELHRRAEGSHAALGGGRPRSLHPIGGRQLGREGQEGTSSTRSSSPEETGGAASCASSYQAQACVQAQPPSQAPRTAEVGVAG